MCARLCTDVLSARFNHLWPSGIAHRPEAPREMCSACRERRGGTWGEMETSPSRQMWSFQMRLEIHKRTGIAGQLKEKLSGPRKKMTQMVFFLHLERNVGKHATRTQIHHRIDYCTGQLLLTAPPLLTEISSLDLFSLRTVSLLFITGYFVSCLCVFCSANIN